MVISLLHELMYDTLAHAMLSRGILHLMRSLLNKARRFISLVTDRLHFSTVGEKGLFVYLMQQNR